MPNSYTCVATPRSFGASLLWVIVTNTFLLLLLCFSPSDFPVRYPTHLQYIGLLSTLITDYPFLRESIGSGYVSFHLNLSSILIDNKTHYYAKVTRPFLHCSALKCALQCRLIGYKLILSLTLMFLKGLPRRKRCFNAVLIKKMTFSFKNE